MGCAREYKGIQVGQRYAFLEAVCSTMVAHVSWTRRSADVRPAGGAAASTVVLRFAVMQSRCRRCKR